MVVAETMVQFGTNFHTDNRLVRLWTHGQVAVKNDLETLSMDKLKDLVARRSTQNITAGEVPLLDFLQHELSPAVRMKHMPHDTLSEMYVHLNKSLDDPVGVSKYGSRYASRTELVVIHQTPAQFLSLFRLHALAEHSTNVVLVVLCTHSTPLWASTFDWRTSGKKAVPLFVDGRVSLVNLLDELLKLMPEEFESCQSPKESLQVHVDVPAPSPTYLCEGEDAKVVAFLGVGGEGALRTLAASVGKFMPYTAYVFGDVSSLHYSYLEDMRECRVEVDASDCSVDTTLAEFLVARPHLQQAVARVLQYSVKRALPDPAAMQILLPLQTLTRQAALLKGKPKYAEVCLRLAAAIEALGLGECIVPLALVNFSNTFTAVRKVFMDNVAAPDSTALFVNRNTSEVLARYKLDVPTSEASLGFISLYNSPLNHTLDANFGALASLGFDGFGMTPSQALSKQVSTHATYLAIPPPK